jgi:hypothetical protein
MTQTRTSNASHRKGTSNLKAPKPMVKDEEIGDATHVSKKKLCHKILFFVFAIA